MFIVFFQKKHHLLFSRFIQPIFNLKFQFKKLFSTKKINLKFLQKQKNETLKPRFFVKFSIKIPLNKTHRPRF